MKHATRALALILLAFTGTGFAAPRVLHLDTEETELSFTLGSTLHTVHGTLFETSGEIRFDLETGEASGQVVIDARRTETGNKKRDKKMHREVLESDDYPEIVFTAEYIEGRLAEGESTEVVLSGQVTIHGESHPLELEAMVQQQGGQLSGRCGFRVPFVKWGMEDPSVFVLRTDKYVDVKVTIHGSLG